MDFPSGGLGITNKHFGELSGHHYILYNWLSENPDLTYIGFGHYRRILAVTKYLQTIPSPISDKKMRKLTNKFSENEISNFIKDYDIILPHKWSFNCSVNEQYKMCHPAEDFDLAIEILKKEYPEYIDAAEEYLNGNSGYYCLNFVMRRNLYIQCFSWIFNILFKLEKERKDVWKTYTAYSNIRTPAYIAERIINIWLIHNIKKYNLKIKETNMIYIDTEENLLKQKPKTLKYLLRKLYFTLKHYCIDKPLKRPGNGYHIRYLLNEAKETIKTYKN